MTEQNTDYDMVASGGNFVAHNPEQSARGIDFPQYNGGKNMGSDINIMKNKIESGGTKEESENEIADDLNEMEYFDEAQLDEDHLDDRNGNDVSNIDQAEERHNDKENSIGSNMETGHEDKPSEQLHNNDSVSDTNQVDGEKGTVKNSQPVVVIKYGCKKCTKISYTEAGYHTHLFRAHRIRNVRIYPAQIIECTMVNPAEVHLSRFGTKEEPTFLCDKCGQLFFHESSIQTHKVHAHGKRDEDDENGNGAVKNTSPVSGENMTDENDAKLEKGREILNKMIRKPGTKKKPTKSAKKRSLPQKRSKGMKNTKLRRSARIANSSAETIDTDQTEITDETKSASEIDKSLPDIIPPRWITRSSINMELKSETRHGNEISPSTDQSAVTNVSSRGTRSGTSKPPINSATKKDQPDHPSPSAVFMKNIRDRN